MDLLPLFPARRRRVGRWLTDVSALRPLLLPAPRLLRPQCTFTLQAPAWAGAWKPTLSLRFSSSPTEVRPMAAGDAGSSSDLASTSSSSSRSGAGSVGSSSRQVAEAAEGGMPPRPQQQPRQRCSEAEAEAAQRAQRLLPLPFAGGDFGPGYNNRTAGGYSFTTPPGLRRALLVVRITGHGWGPETEGCAEFCGTQHSFQVNGEGQYDYSIRFEQAGQLWACADQVRGQQFLARLVCAVGEVGMARHGMAWHSQSCTLKACYGWRHAARILERLQHGMARACHLTSMLHPCLSAGAQRRGAQPARHVPVWQVGFGVGAALQCNCCSSMLPIRHHCTAAVAGAHAASLSPV